MVDAQPRPLRWLLHFTTAFSKLFRVLLAVQGVGGAVRLVIGAATLNGKDALIGAGQVAFAAGLLAFSHHSESVLEVRGPNGEFVIRSDKHRKWRDVRGLRRVSAFVWGGHVWSVVIRRREDDPFGGGVYSENTDTQRESFAVVEHLTQKIRTGDEPNNANNREDGQRGSANG